MANRMQRDDQDDQPDMPRERHHISVVNLPQHIAAALEPLIRKVVQEEVDRGLSRSPLFLDWQQEVQMISASPEPSLYRLVFKNPPHIPIFSGSKIEDTDGSPLQILLVAADSSGSSSLPSPIKIEFVVLDGDFPSNDDYWTSDEFNKAIVKEREGRRPLLIGDVNNITMRNGCVITGDLQFTDNSSWTRSRHFRIGVRVVPGSCEPGLIKEATTKKFTVRDRRGETYKKHYPPVLTDEVFRLKKISKDGVFHKKLSKHNIHNVQAFLQLWVVDSGQLRQILGVGMSDRMWDTMIKHALTCDLGNKFYFYSGRNVVIFLNSICQIVRITIGGIPCSLKDLSISNRDYVQQLVLEAYNQWGNLREADEMFPSISQMRSESVVQEGPISQQWQDFEAGDLDEEATSSKLPFASNAYNFHQMN